MRAELLERVGAIAQEPYVESTARYRASMGFGDLELPPGVSGFLAGLGERELLFDPPYDHQVEAIELALGSPSRDLVVTTGTGSGKTETFLLPILGRLADEATNSASFGTRALANQGRSVLSWRGRYGQRPVRLDASARRGVVGHRRCCNLYRSDRKCPRDCQ